MKKIAIALSLIVLAANGALEARGGGGGRGGGFHGGGHGGYHGGGRGWGGRGGWGGGWGGGFGWGGPAFGVGVNIPLGGPDYVAPEPVVVQQPVVVAPAPQTQGQVVQNPYDRYRSLFNSDPVKNRKSYRRWLFDNYAPDQAQYWYNFFLTNYYNPYQASKPTASLSIGTGIGFGGGAYYGRGWGGGWRR